MPGSQLETADSEQSPGYARTSLIQNISSNPINLTPASQFLKDDTLQSN
jgi:hypothetical protein